MSGALTFDHANGTIPAPTASSGFSIFLSKSPRERTIFVKKLLYIPVLRSLIAECV